MDSYAAGGDNAVTATPGDTCLAVYAPGTTRRGYLFYFLLTVPGVPVADNVLAWQVRRFTARGTATAQVPGLFDPASPPAVLQGDIDHTVEPTYTTGLFPSPGSEGYGVHQRNLMFWNARPGGELVLPATLSNGIGFTPIHGSFTGLASAVAHWSE